MANKTLRAKNWCFLVYPENADIRTIEYAGLPCAYSPIHSPDSKDDDGGEKKKHIHVIVCFPRPVSQSTAQRISDSLSGVLAFPCGSLSSYFDYFTHKNNPEKEQFAEDQKPVCLHGFTISSLDEEDEYSWLFGDLLIRPEIKTFADAVAACMGERPNSVGLLVSKSYAVNLFLISKDRG